MSQPRSIVPLAVPPDVAVHVPGSTSISNRALVAAALAHGESRLEGVLFADDTEAMLAALASLGIALEIDRERTTVVVHGSGGVIPAAAATLDARQRQAEAEEKNKREVEMRLSEALYRGALAWAVPSFVDDVAERLAANPDYRKEFIERLRLDGSTLANIKKGADYFFDVLVQQKD